MKGAPKRPDHIKDAVILLASLHLPGHGMPGMNPLYMATVETMSFKLC